MMIKTFLFNGILAGALISCQESDTVNIATQNVLEAQKNKQIVWQFYQRLFGDKDLSAIDTFVDEDYIQHNPYVADGAEAFKKAAAGWFKGATKEKVDVQRISADGDLVFIHVKNKNNDGSLKSTVDIFRLKDGKIMEHWDVQEDVPLESSNQHPMF